MPNLDHLGGIIPDELYPETTRSFPPPVPWSRFGSNSLQNLVSFFGPDGTTFDLILNYLDSTYYTNCIILLPSAAACRGCSGSRGDGRGAVDVSERGGEVVPVVPLLLLQLVRELVLEGLKAERKVL